MKEHPFLRMYKVVFAELATGEILKTDLEKSHGEGIIFVRFKSFTKAMDYADTILQERPDLEYVIYCLEKPVVYRNVNQTIQLPDRDRAITAITSE